jgi:hemerythrin-like domain-containing protein
MNVAVSFSRQVSRTLDREHAVNLELLARVEQACAHAPRGKDGQLRALVDSFAAHLEHEIGRHFGFEEQELFPRLQAAGSGDITALLLEEHEAIRGVAAELLPLAQAVKAGTLHEAGWAQLRRCALELVERLRAHIEKETLGLLPMVDDVLDEDEDQALVLAYAAA